VNKWELGFWFAVFYGLGLITNYFMEWFETKGHKKAQPVQPQIEVYGKNYKKINNVSKFDRVG
jgi:hypothetical protein